MFLCVLNLVHKSDSSFVSFSRSCRSAGNLKLYYDECYTFNLLIVIMDCHTCKYLHIYLSKNKYIFCLLESFSKIDCLKYNHMSFNFLL